MIKTGGVYIVLSLEYEELPSILEIKNSISID